MFGQPGQRHDGVDVTGEGEVGVQLPRAVVVNGATPLMLLQDRAVDAGCGPLLLRDPLGDGERAVAERVGGHVGAVVLLDRDGDVAVVGRRQRAVDDVVVDAGGRRRGESSRRCSVPELPVPDPSCGMYRSIVCAPVGSGGRRTLRPERVPPIGDRAAVVQRGQVGLGEVVAAAGRAGSPPSWSRRVSPLPRSAVLGGERGAAQLAGPVAPVTASIANGTNWMALAPV